MLSRRNRAIVLTFLDTGLRLSELAGIRLEDVDTSRVLIRVVGKGAKESSQDRADDPEGALSLPDAPPG